MLMPKTAMAYAPGFAPAAGAVWGAAPAAAAAAACGVLPCVNLTASSQL